MKRIQKNIMPSGRSFFISFGGTIVASFLLPHLSMFEPTSGEFLGKFGAGANQAAVVWSGPRKTPAPALRGEVKTVVIR